MQFERFVVFNRVVCCVGLGVLSAAAHAANPFLEQFTGADRIRMEVEYEWTLESDRSTYSGVGTVSYVQEGQRYRVRVDLSPSLVAAGLQPPTEYVWDGRTLTRLDPASEAAIVSSYDYTEAPTSLPTPLAILGWPLVATAERDCSGCRLTTQDLRRLLVDATLSGRIESMADETRLRSAGSRSLASSVSVMHEGQFGLEVPRVLFGQGAQGVHTIEYQAYQRSADGFVYPRRVIGSQQSADGRERSTFTATLTVGLPAPAEAFAVPIPKSYSVYDADTQQFLRPQGRSIEAP